MSVLNKNDIPFIALIFSSQAVFGFFLTHHKVFNVKQIYRYYIIKIIYKQLCNLNCSSHFVSLAITKCLLLFYITLSVLLTIIINIIKYYVKLCSKVVSVIWRILYVVFSIYMYTLFTIL